MVNKIGKEKPEHLISVANVLHAENPLAVEDDWIEEYDLAEGNVDVTAVDPELVTTIPSATQMGKSISGWQILKFTGNKSLFPVNFLL